MENLCHEARHLPTAGLPGDNCTCSAKYNHRNQRVSEEFSSVPLVAKLFRVVAKVLMVNLIYKLD